MTVFYLIKRWKKKTVPIHHQFKKNHVTKYSDWWDINDGWRYLSDAKVHFISPKHHLKIILSFPIELTFKKCKTLEPFFDPLYVLFSLIYEKIIEDILEGKKKYSNYKHMGQGAVCQICSVLHLRSNSDTSNIACFSFQSHSNSLSFL